MTVRHMLQDVSINKVYDELLLANKTIDGAGNIVNGNGIVIERIDIPAGEEYIYTNAYSVYFIEIMARCLARLIWVLQREIISQKRNTIRSIILQGLE